MNINKHDLPLTTSMQTDFFDITLARNGYRGIATNVCQTDYLESASNFAAFCTGVRSAKGKGYDIWLYDEKLYPSGMADNKVLNDHPDWECEGLLMYKTSLSANESVNFSMPGKLILAKAIPVSDTGVQYDSAEDISTSFVNGTLNWTAANGTWKVVLITEDVLYTGYQAGTERGGETPHYPSLLMPEVTNLFLTYTHKRYAQAFGEPLGNYFTSTFTDEPSSMALSYNSLGYGVYPWKQLVSDSLKARYGYDLKDKLARIVLDNGSEGKQLRYQYFSVISDLMSQNYFGIIKDYCHSQHFKSGGHLLLEESLCAQVPLYGNIMACYRQLDIPGVDCLTGLPNKTRAYMISSRLAASAAELEGHSRVMYESCPIDNDLPNSQEPPAIDIKGVHNRVMIGGVTDFNNYLKLSYETFSGRKAFNTYIARVLTLLSGGVRASRVAVYYPIETMWTKFRPSDMRINTWFNVKGADPEASSLEDLFDNVSFSLLDHGWEYSYVDAQGLEESVVKDKQLCHDSLRWDVIILPGVETLPKAAYDKLTDFVDHGGKVILQSRLPVNSDTEFPSTDITNQFKTYVANNTVTYNSTFNSGNLNTQLETLIGRDITLSSYDSVMCSHKRINDQEVYFLINDASTSKTLTVSLPDTYNWELWNPQTGAVSSVTPRFTWTFAQYDGLILRSTGLAQSTLTVKKNQFRMYPNPTTGLLTINLPVNITGDVRIINMMGKTERLFTNVTRQVDLGGLNAGIYLVQVNTDNNVYTNLIQKI
ncbi:MAG: glycosyl hydrolase [Bacteroidota bacterium]|nr:glycosyl hydrolase [Bacteroidota bacterium]